mmetsp:Transcript_36074/g.117861  ORF Transcript_36074/g.117861 Transcript_36074/m.117861 type:complete len:253 (+) Transcript_36074:355-1113(+)
MLLTSSTQQNACESADSRPLVPMLSRRELPMAAAATPPAVAPAAAALASSALRVGVQLRVVERAHPMVPEAARGALHPRLLLRVLRLLRVEVPPPPDLDLDKACQRHLPRAERHHRRREGRVRGTAAAPLRPLPLLLVAVRAELRRGDPHLHRLGHLRLELPKGAHRVLQRPAALVAVTRRPLHEQRVLAAPLERAAKPQLRRAQPAQQCRRLWRAGPRRLGRTTRRRVGAELDGVQPGAGRARDDFARAPP